MIPLEGPYRAERWHRRRHLTAPRLSLLARLHRFFASLAGEG